MSKHIVKCRIPSFGLTALVSLYVVCVSGALLGGGVVEGETSVKGITKESWGTTRSGQTVDRYTLVNDYGSMLRVISLGATATELHVRDRNGRFADVVLGYDTVAEFEVNAPYFGCTIGRVANRISNARFELNGVTYKLARNFGKHHLHGGVVGLTRRVWKGEELAHDLGPAVSFSYESPDGEDGYPGNVSVRVVYVLTQADGMRIEYTATTDQTTPVNLTNHSYFNLSGAGAESIRDHLLTLNADGVTEVDADTIPTGKILPVAGTPLDFRQPKRIGEHIDDLAMGYDHNLLLNHGQSAHPTFSAEVYEPASGRVLQLYTTEPAVQLYTSYYLEKTIGKGGAEYVQFSAFCLETQHFPDSVNRPQFPSVILHPGDTYLQITEYRFSVR